MRATFVPIGAIFIALSVFFTNVLVSAFQARQSLLQVSSRLWSPSTLWMGRAAAVRAATKARTDAAKSKNNNIFAKKIITVVKAGGPDPEVNRQLGIVIQDAKAANVPNDVIKRNIEKASSTQTADYRESVFEFVGPGGAYILVNVVTDNDNRATAEVNLIGKKNNLKAGSKGSVSFNFVRKSRLDVKSVIDEDELMTLCLEHGVDDYELRTAATGSTLDPKEEGYSVVYVDTKDMAALRDALRAKGLQLETSIAQVPRDGVVDLSDEDFEANLAAFDAFLALDDVDTVEHNINTSVTDE